MRVFCTVAMVFGPVALAQTSGFRTRRCADLRAMHGMPWRAAADERPPLGYSRRARCEGATREPCSKPGKSAESRLLHYLTGEKSALNPRGLRMPMGGEPIAPKDIATVRSWIDAGAEWPASASAAAAGVAKKNPLPWSFQPVRRPSVPAVQNRQWVRNDIDAFILSRLESEKIKPSAEADRTTLIRRLSLDLIGLPPTPEEVRAFVADARPNAYEHLVDRLLASAHFGEKWGRFWLDQARYADSEGHELDRDRPYGWRYRDWVIDSVNRDQPFDQFTVEQIAGDLLAESHNRAVDRYRIPPQRPGRSRGRHRSRRSRNSRACWTAPTRFPLPGWDSAWDARSATITSSIP